MLTEKSVVGFYIIQDENLFILIQLLLIYWILPEEIIGKTLLQKILFILMILISC